MLWQLVMRVIPLFSEKAGEDHETLKVNASSAGGTLERKSPQHSLSLGRANKTKKQPEKEETPAASSTMPRKKFTVPAVLQKTLKNKFPAIAPQPRVPSATESQFMLQLRQLRIPDDGKRKLKSEIQRLDHEIRKYMNNNSSKNVDELSDLVQNAYTRFADVVHNDARFEIATNEDRDIAIDFFEKVVMTQNHKWVIK